MPSGLGRLVLNSVLSLLVCIQWASAQQFAGMGRGGGKTTAGSCTARAIEAQCRPAADDDWLRNNPPGDGQSDPSDLSADLLACLTFLCPHLGDPVDVCSDNPLPIEAQVGLMYDGTLGWGYNNDNDCSREVRVPEGQHMSFIFVEWRLHDSEDWVAIYDVATNHAIFSNAGVAPPAFVFSRSSNCF